MLLLLLLVCAYYGIEKLSKESFLSLFTFRTSTNVYLLNLAIADIVTLVFGGFNHDHYVFYVDECFFGGLNDDHS